MIAIFHFGLLALSTDQWRSVKLDAPHFKIILSEDVKSFETIIKFAARPCWVDNLQIIIKLFGSAKIFPQVCLEILSTAGNVYLLY